jgi:hypothetical protein
MRSQLVFDAMVQVPNRFQLARVLSMATREFHRPGTRIADTINDSLVRFQSASPIAPTTNRSHKAGDISLFPDERTRAGIRQLLLSCSEYSVTIQARLSLLERVVESSNFKRESVLHQRVFGIPDFFARHVLFEKNSKPARGLRIYSSKAGATRAAGSAFVFARTSKLCDLHRFLRSPV